MTSSHDNPRLGLERHELALLAHEVRGALTVVAGMSELLRRELSSAEKERALEGISRAAERIDRLIEEALGGEIWTPTSRERVDLAPLAEQVAAEQQAVTGREVIVTVDAPTVVMGSHEALERALANLIENGLKYSLAATPVEVTVGAGDGKAYLSVADRGPGIAPADRERIFTPFVRVEGVAASGTGLGLTVVKNVAESHGGRVSVRERAGGGSIFEIELPIAPG